METITDIKAATKRAYNKPLLIKVGKAIPLTLGVGWLSSEKRGFFGG